MSKRAPRVFVLFGLLFMALLSVNVVRSSSTLKSSSEIVVPDQYSTIQEAINNAVDGDSIFVRAGTYYEHVVIGKAVSVVGEDRSATIVDGGGTGYVMSILCDNVSVTGFTIQRGQFGIYVLNSKYVSIFNNIVRHNYGSDWDAGIRLEYADYTTIHDNMITDNWRGVLLYAFSPYVSVYGNNVTSNEYGIRVAMGGSSNVNISGNYVANNRGYGIDVTGFGGEAQSNYATIAKNLIVNNTYEAVGLGEGSNYNTVIQNSMVGNGHAGVTLERYSNNNTVVKNDIVGNAYGICFDIFTVNSTQNTIFNNNIINNTQQVRIVSGSVNAWNGSYPCGGNYWSDYVGLDQFSGSYQNVTGSDGIGDASYVIDLNNVDNYPLMDPWSSNACDWTVDDDGPADFGTIQEAVNNAVDGDSIFVKAGTYYEHVVVNKTLSLFGEDVSTTIIDGNETGRVIDVVSDNVNITGFTVQRSGSIFYPDLDAGICLDGTTGCGISENRIIDKGFIGISLLYSQHSRIVGNNVSGTEWGGIHMLGSSHNIVSRNAVDNTTHEYGVGINGHASSHYNTITENVISNSKYGMFYHDSRYNIICRNNISAISVEGIWLQEQVNHNTVAENNLVNCSVGIRLLSPNYNNTITRNNISMNRYGFYVESSQNFIYHNNVLNNTQQAYVVPESVNLWDNGYPSGGNYWSDYNGIDADGDGIGDTPYVIDAYNVDRYPLINPWIRLVGDINDDGTVDIFDAILLANAFNSVIGMPNWNPDADLNNDNVIDIFDAILLANNFNKHVP